MLSTENKKLERLKKVLEHGGQTKDVVMFDLLIEELSEYFNTSTGAITEAIQRLQDREEKETVVNVEAPTVNVPAPIVNVDAPIVTVDAPVVNVDTKELSEGVRLILKQLQEQIPFTIEQYVKDGRIKVEVDRVGSGGGGVISFPIVDAISKAAILAGTGANGTRELTSANTWYAVPTTVPTVPYMLVVTQENASGTIRWGFSNTGTPSATNGNQAPNELQIKLKGGQVVYYASSTAGDDVNWTTKNIE